MMKMSYLEALQLVGKGKYVAADELIIQALNKQIPKKPKECMCPVCGESVVGHEYPQKFCKNCGQAILWRAEE